MWFSGLLIVNLTVFVLIQKTVICPQERGIAKKRFTPIVLIKVCYAWIVMTFLIANTVMNAWIAGIVTIANFPRCVRIPVIFCFAITAIIAEIVLAV